MILTMHKCRICGAIFWHSCKNTYCTKWIPCFAREDTKKRYIAFNNALERKRERARAEDYIEARRKRDIERWHKRMENPAFRESERLRSLERAKRHRMEAGDGN